MVSSYSPTWTDVDFPSNGGLVLAADGGELVSFNWGMDGGTDSGVAATCDDRGLGSASSTVKADPAIHNAKLM